MALCTKAVITATVNGSVESLCEECGSKDPKHLEGRPPVSVEEKEFQDVDNYFNNPHIRDVMLVDRRLVTI